MEVFSDICFDFTDRYNCDEQEMRFVNWNGQNRVVVVRQDDRELPFLHKAPQLHSKSLCKHDVVFMSCQRIDFEVYVRDKDGNEVGVKVSGQKENENTTTENAQNDSPPDSRDRDTGQG